jgi:hypothetical protein
MAINLNSAANYGLLAAAGISNTGATIGAMSYREWLATWPDSDPGLVAHRAAIIVHFGL